MVPPANLSSSSPLTNKQSVVPDDRYAAKCVTIDCHVAEGRERQMSGHQKLAIRCQLPQKFDADAGCLYARTIFIIYPAQHHPRSRTRRYRIGLRKNPRIKSLLSSSPMSALGQKQTFAAQIHFTPKSGHMRCTSACPLRAKSGHELLHSIIWSARCCTARDTSMPNTFAVLRLITSSNFVGCSTGRSAGMAPRKILST